MKYRKYCTRKRVIIFFLCLFVLYLFLEFRYGAYIRYMRVFTRGKHAVATVLGDTDHFEKTKLMEAREEYRRRQLLSAHKDWFCKNEKRSSYMVSNLQSYEEIEPTQKIAFITVIKNEKYVLPGIALGHSINKFSCVETKIATISSSIGPKSREALTAVGWTLIERPVIDCITKKDPNEPDKPGYGFGYKADIPGSQMKFYNWNYTQYDKLMYIDTDIILLDTIDEIFNVRIGPGEIAACYCQRPWRVDPCFNTGLILLRPHEQTFVEMVALWRSLYSSVGCTNDQSYLYHYFMRNENNVKYLPFGYNVRRQNYHPMMLYHFGGHSPLKPWLVPHSRDDPEVADRVLLEMPGDMYKVWWAYMYEALDTYKLDKWYEWFQSEDKPDI